MASKSMVAFTAIVITVAFIGSMSVVGLLQSNERIGSSGLIIRPPPPPPPPSPSSSLSPPPPPPPEPTIDIDIYSDSAGTQPISNVKWGTIEVGDSKKRVVYVKNSGDDKVVLSLSTDNWSPAGAEDALHLSWDYDGSALNTGAIIKLKLTLEADSSDNGIETFSFDIIITGSAH